MAVTTVNTRYGTVEGISYGEYSGFLGIPYAKAPVGNLRWKAPVRPDTWEGIYHADRFPNRGPQLEFTDTVHEYGKEFYSDPVYSTKQSEDCLYLNIWTPAVSSDEKLPVAFWIHGGAFDHGYGHEQEFDGEEYCKRGVILVSINYRLGVFGFLAHPFLTAEDPNHTSGNYGMLDQIAALSWVRENIACFGGDPEKITIFGQSAGGVSVNTLISSELTDGMIAGAILQSSVGLTKHKYLEQAEQDGIWLFKELGISSLEELRALSTETVFNTAMKLAEERAAEGEFILLYSPLIDGYVLKGSFEELASVGAIKDIPYMFGSTKDDLGTSKEAQKNGSLGIIHEAAISRCENQLSLNRTPAYLYYFKRNLPGEAERALEGAFHSSELWYMFGTQKRWWRPLTEEDKALSDEMLDAWTGFMKNGNPENGRCKEWKAYTAGQPYVKELDC